MDSRFLFGSHPWSDVSRIDWTALPRSEAEMIAGMDTSLWATPSNPNPEDRLHLRTAPRRDAASLGKYYNGTPVRVLERPGDWTRVDICGVEGYMMTRFLAFGEAVQHVDQHLLGYNLLLTQETAPLYAHWEDVEPRMQMAVAPLIIGVVGDAWYHVWDHESGVSGYMRQSDFWPGNG